MNKFIKIFGTTTLISLMSSSYAQTVCVYDPAGTQGEGFLFMKDYAIAAKLWGAELILKPYSSDDRAMDDFTNKKCDALSIMGARIRALNSFTSSIDSLGGVPDDTTAKMVIGLMANPKLAPEMVKGNTEIAGVYPLGAGYVMVNDRSINSMAKMAGKTIGVLDFEQTEQFVADRLGSKTIPITISSVGNKFNSGQVDIVALPLIAFKALNLAKGMGEKGAIIKFPVGYLTNQIIIYPDKFPDGYGQKSRTWVGNQLSNQFKAVQKIEGAIDARYWLDLPLNDKLGYEKLFRQIRISLVKDGTYNSRMMEILKKIRCKEHPNNYDCNLKDE